MEIALKTAQEHLEMWLNAEAEIATSQSYTIGTRTLTRANLKEVRDQIKFWQSKVAELKRMESGKGRNRAYRAIPRDI